MVTKRRFYGKLILEVITNNHLHVSNKDGGKTNSSGPVGKDEGKVKKSNLKIDDIISNGDNSELNMLLGSKGEGVKGNSKYF